MIKDTNTKLKGQKLLFEFISQITFGAYQIKEIKDFKIDDYDNNKLNYFEGLAISGFINITLEHKEDKELKKEVCLYATVTDEILLHSAYLSFYKDNVTTPIELIVGPFNSKIKYKRLSEALSDTNKNVVTKFKV